MTPKNYFFSNNGVLLRYSFVYAHTHNYFGNYIKEHSDECPCCDIKVTPEYMRKNRWLVNKDEDSDAFLEFQSLMLATGNELLIHKRALFHGVAVLWRGYAWLITAPSGTGKTTQLRHWRNILGNNVKVINGDKPLIECREDGSVWVHSSPWRGKERYGIPGISAPLGGIILLKQDNRNQIHKLKPYEAVMPLFVEFVSFPENTEQIICQAQVLSQMLDAVPVWELKNLGNEASAILTHEAIEDFLKEKQNV